MLTRIWTLLTIFAVLFATIFQGVDAGSQDLPADCAEKCTKWPAMCNHVDYCVNSCSVASVQKTNCQKWKDKKEKANKKSEL
mmetsp:Transcript_20923/g.31226  ORF Transcript_20923/g.31226 Transcript_20923/m.31226 type:complete len:82 (+) Transcript_20923:75-320(+)